MRLPRRDSRITSANAGVGVVNPKAHLQAVANDLAAFHHQGQAGLWIAEQPRTAQRIAVQHQDIRIGTGFAAKKICIPPHGRAGQRSILSVCATINIDDGPGDLPRRGSCEERDSRRHILRFAVSTKRYEGSLKVCEITISRIHLSVGRTRLD